MTKKIEITLAQLWEVLDERYRYLVVESNGDIWAHTKNTTCHDYGWLTHAGSIMVVSGEAFDIKEFKSKDWKKCIAKRPVDYSKWKGKLCYFSDEYEKLNRGHIGILEQYNINYNHPFKAAEDGYFSHCQPLTKEETLKLIVRGER